MENKREKEFRVGLDKKQVEEYKFNSSNGGVRYLGVNHNNNTITTDYYRYNGGHRPLDNSQLKELRRLQSYYKNILGYEEEK